MRGRGPRTVERLTRPIALIINAAKRFGGWVRIDYPLEPPGVHVALVALCGKDTRPDPPQPLTRVRA
jgi:hypothetical protein